MEKMLLTAEALATALSVKVSTIRKWTVTTDMPRVKRQRLVRYELSAVLAWLKGETVQPLEA